MKAILQLLSGVVAFVAGSSGLLSILPHGVQAVIGVLGSALTVLGIRNASQTPPTAQAILDRLGSGWKTLAGVVIAAVGALSAPDVFNLLPPAAGKLVTLVGTVLAALGLYHAASKK